MASVLESLRTALAGRYVLERALELGRGGMATVYLMPGSFTQRRG